MGHLAIVNQTTIERITDDHPYISIGGELGKQVKDKDKDKSHPYKTISDLFADALIVRRGDIIFTWMVNEKGKLGVGFDRYYIASGSVVFDETDLDHPIKIGVTKGYLYKKAVPEEKALYLFRDRLLWNAIGKKSLGRGRSLSHQTKDEDKQLKSLLKKANKDDKPLKILFSPQNKIDNYTRITINNFGDTQNPPIESGTKLGNVPVNDICWNSGDEFLEEKTLEAFLCENYDKKLLFKNKDIIEKVSFCSLLGHPHHRIKWLGNYLSYGVAGKNIDLVCEIKKGNKSVIVVIELKKESNAYKKYKEIIDDQLNSYTQFIRDAFKSYRGNNFLIEQVVLTHSPRKNLAPGAVRYQNTKWIGYDIDPKNGTVTFTKVL